MQASPQRVDNTGSFSGGGSGGGGGGGGGGDLLYGQSASGLQLTADYATDAPLATGRGVHGVKSRAAQQRLRASQQQQPQQQQPQQPGSGPLSTNRMRTLTMSTPHLTDHPKHAHFNFINHMAARDSTVLRAHFPVLQIVPILLVPTCSYTMPAPFDTLRWQLPQSAASTPSEPRQTPEAWWGSTPAQSRAQSIQLVRCHRNAAKDSNGGSGSGGGGGCGGGGRRRLSTMDSVFGAVTPPPL